MGKTITCECGHTIRAGEDEELLRLARAHITEAHPDLVGKVSDEDLLAMAAEG